LANAYTRARIGWADYWAEKVLLISLDSWGDVLLDQSGKAITDHANVQRARLRTDTIKWLVGKYAPRVYGDKPANDAGAHCAKVSPASQQITRIERVIIHRREPVAIASSRKEGAE
jgi:hypothetical protein